MEICTFGFAAILNFGQGKGLLRKIKYFGTCCNILHCETAQIRRFMSPKIVLCRIQSSLKFPILYTADKMQIFRSGPLYHFFWEWSATTFLHDRLQSCDKICSLWKLVCGLLGCCCLLPVMTGPHPLSLSFPEWNGALLTAQLVCRPAWNYQKIQKVFSKISDQIAVKFLRTS